MDGILDETEEFALEEDLYLEDEDLDAVETVKKYCYSPLQIQRLAHIRGIPSVAMAADVQHCIDELVPLACDLASSEEPADIRMVALQQLPDLGRVLVDQGGVPGITSSEQLLDAAVDAIITSNDNEVLQHEAAAAAAGICCILPAPNCESAINKALSKLMEAGADPAAAGCRLLALAAASGSLSVSPSSMDLLSRLSQHQEHIVRQAAAVALGPCALSSQDLAVVTKLQELLAVSSKDHIWVVRHAAARQLPLVAEAAAKLHYSIVGVSHEEGIMSKFVEIWETLAEDSSIWVRQEANMQLGLLVALMLPPSTVDDDVVGATSAHMPEDVSISTPKEPVAASPHTQPSTTSVAGSVAAESSTDSQQTTCKPVSEGSASSSDATTTTLQRVDLVSDTIVPDRVPAGTDLPGASENDKHTAASAAPSSISSEKEAISLSQSRPIDSVMEATVAGSAVAEPKKVALTSPPYETAASHDGTEQTLRDSSSSGSTSSTTTTTAINTHAEVSTTSSSGQTSKESNVQNALVDTAATQAAGEASGTVCAAEQSTISTKLLQQERMGPSAGIQPRQEFVISELMLDRLLEMAETQPVPPPAASTLLDPQSHAPLNAAKFLPVFCTVLGPAKWSSLRLVLFALMQSINPEVHSMLLLAIAELAHILGPEVRDAELEPAAVELVASPSSAVQCALASNLRMLLTAFPSQRFQKACLTALKEVVQTNGDGSCHLWRTRWAAACQLPKVANLLGQDLLSGFLAPCALDLCQDTVATVRSSAALCIGPILLRMHDLSTASLGNGSGQSSDHEDSLNFLGKLQALGTGSSFQQRQIFAAAAVRLLGLCGLEDAVELLLPLINACAEDAVPNVRYTTAAVLKEQLESQVVSVDNPAVLELLSKLHSDISSGAADLLGNFNVDTITVLQAGS